MGHAFDLTDAENLGIKDAREGEPPMDLKTFTKYAGRPLRPPAPNVPVYLANGTDTVGFAYEIYRDAYRNATDEA
jgi:hypothetical protein